MRGIKIILVVTAIIALSFSVSSAQQSLLLFVKPEILQPAHKTIISSFNTIDYRDINIPLKSPARVVFEFDELSRMQSLVNSSV